MPVTDARIRDTIAGLLRERAAVATICPSEAARALAPQDWRPLMPRVRDAAVAMAKAGELVIRQGGRALHPDATLRGPIRLGRMPRDED